MPNSGQLFSPDAAYFPMFPSIALSILSNYSPDDWESFVTHFNKMLPHFKRGPYQISGLLEKFKSMKIEEIAAFTETYLSLADADTQGFGRFTTKS